MWALDYLLPSVAFAIAVHDRLIRGWPSRLRLSDDGETPLSDELVQHVLHDAGDSRIRLAHDSPVASSVRVVSELDGRADAIDELRRQGEVRHEAREPDAPWQADGKRNGLHPRQPRQPAPQRQPLAGEHREVDLVAADVDHGQDRHAEPERHLDEARAAVEVDGVAAPEALQAIQLAAGVYEEWRAEAQDLLGVPR